MKKKEICVPVSTSGWDFGGVTVILSHAYNPNTNKIVLVHEGCGIVPLPQAVAYPAAVSKSGLDKLIEDIFKDGNPS